MEASGSPESYLTVADVAELLQLNQQTVRNWIDQGSLPALRVGRRVRIKRSDLDRVLEAGSTVGGAGGGPSGDDFWGGRVVGAADPDPEAPGPDPAPAAESADVPPADEDQTPSNGNGSQE
jgi:excisionase family DNA binding protein